MDELLDLCQPSWREFTIEGGDSPVELVRLRRDNDGPGFTVLVRFPPGWSRPGVGSYDVAEEALFLDGAFVMSGVWYRSGDYAWFPPGCRREDSVTPAGAVVLAWFSAPNRLLDATTVDPLATPESVTPLHWTDEARVATPFGRGWCLRQASDRSAWIVDAVDAGAPAAAAAELFSINARMWAYVELGAPLPTLRGPVYARARHT